MKMLGMVSGFTGDEPRGIVIGTGVATVSAALSVVCAWSLARIIRGVDRRQLRRAAILGHAAPAAPYAQAA